MNRRNYLALMGAAAGAVATSSKLPHRSLGLQTRARPRLQLSQIARVA